MWWWLRHVLNIVIWWLYSVLKTVLLYDCVHDIVLLLVLSWAFFYLFGSCLGLRWHLFQLSCRYSSTGSLGLLNPKLNFDSWTWIYALDQYNYYHYYFYLYSSIYILLGSMQGSNYLYCYLDIKITIIILDISLFNPI